MPQVTGTKSNSTPWTAFFVDLMIYLVVMFGVGELYVSGLGFVANALLMSFVTSIVASWRMRARGVTWRDVGLRKPDSLKKTLVARGESSRWPLAGSSSWRSSRIRSLPNTGEHVSDEAATWKCGDLRGDGQSFVPAGFS
jgi:hypothetical protein